MLLVNLKVILEKHGKALTTLLPIAPTIQRVKELNLNGSIISNSSELSNVFNGHFSTIGQLHDDVILLQLPESLSVLFSRAN